MAKLLYDYWFVQFDFPNAEGKPYKSSGGKMVYNEELKREVPEGWGDATLLNLCYKIGDGIHSTPKYKTNSKYHFINGNNLKDGFIRITNKTKTVDEIEFQKYYIDLNQNSILLSINGTIGNLALYKGESIILGKSAAYLNTKPFYRDFCYYHLESTYIQKQLWNIATGSTIKNLSLKSLKNLKILKPNENIIERFSSLLKVMQSKRLNNFRENQHLTSLRDWLLPMLMNGQVTVSDKQEA